MRPVPIHPNSDAGARTVAKLEHFRELDAKAYECTADDGRIPDFTSGSPGHRAGRNETYPKLAVETFGGSVAERYTLNVTAFLGDGWCPTAGHYRMNVRRGALAEMKNGGIEQRLETRYLDHKSNDIRRRHHAALKYKARRRGRIHRCCSQRGCLLQRLIDRNITPDTLTDQGPPPTTNLIGYFPPGPECGTSQNDCAKATPKNIPAFRLRYNGPARETDVGMQKRAPVTFDYGNNLPAGPTINVGCKCVRFPRNLVPGRYIRPAFLGKDTRCALALLAKEQASRSRGLPSNLLRCRWATRQKSGVAFNKLVREGKVKAPIVIGRDHLGYGFGGPRPTAKPKSHERRSDAGADWPVTQRTHQRPAAPPGIAAPRWRCGSGVFHPRGYGHRGPTRQRMTPKNASPVSSTTPRHAGVHPPRVDAGYGHRPGHRPPI
ncbi:hypothetical protein FQR65_LT19722 [Abscondita terminalis]|nr:hypothetical protein FQR65_LT19722 [Abscondita terminalis]